MGIACVIILSGTMTEVPFNSVFGSDIKVGGIKRKGDWCGRGWIASVKECWWDDWIAQRFLPRHRGIDHFEVVSDEGSHVRTVNVSGHNTFNVMCSSVCCGKGFGSAAWEVNLFLCHIPPWGFVNESGGINGSCHSIFKQTAINVVLQEPEWSMVKNSSPRE